MNILKATQCKVWSNLKTSVMEMRNPTQHSEDCIIMCIIYGLQRANDFDVCKLIERLFKENLVKIR